ncbi:MAG: response regulator transcription factor [Pseudobutyrivibrio sp.]|nr:response regulator transcription factor [Pseudobutyrivibrio sp.]
MKILLAEDTLDLNNVVTQMLELQGFDVDSALDGKQALDLALSNGYDGIILDIMMPKLDGLQVLREIRRRNIVTPVLMLTAKAEVDDRVEGLDAGADDYLTKPFAMKELLARVKALTRRGSQYAAREMTFGDITLKSDSLELTASNTVRLSLKEFALMQALLLNQEHPVDNNYLIEHVWNEEEDVAEDTVWLYINFLQGKLEYVDSTVIITGDKGGPFQVVVNE